MADEVLMEKRGHVAILTLNRPEAMNSINTALASALGTLLDQADADPDVRAIVITGAGRAFCAGMDLKAFASGESAMINEHPEWGFGGIAQHVLKKPVIAAVNGVAAGGGAEIALASDLIVAGESIKIGFPEVTVGLAAAAGGILRLQRQVNRKIALEMVLTGTLITAARAYEIGLVNKVVPDADVLDEALKLAEKIAGNAPLGVQVSKQFMREGDRFGSDWDPEIWAYHDEVVLPIFDSEDAKEGPRAFVEKRAPHWTGK